MTSDTGSKLKVFFDSDVIIAGCASQVPSASSVLLQLAELTLIEGCFSPYVKQEVERNLRAKLPKALPIFRTLIDEALVEVKDPTKRKLIPFKGMAHDKDTPVLGAAILSNCQVLATFNIKDYWNVPDNLEILEAGTLVRRIRQQLLGLS